MTGPECFCGSELKGVPLPEDLASLAGRDFIWVHVHNGDTLCYPGEDNTCLADVPGGDQ